MAEIFAPGSIAGPAGPPVTFMGAYSAGATYATGQAVSSAGASYISLINSNVGNNPASSPTQWGLLAAAGAPGAAGSAAAITSLAASFLPPFVGQNLFDLSRVTAGLAPSATDGTLIDAGGGGNCSCTALIYCPGATSMVSDLPVDAGNWSGEGICLYDTNGTFMSAIPTSAFTGHVVGGETVIGGTAWTLPGTQTYVRFGYVRFDLGAGNGWAQSEVLGRIYATVSGTATLPGSFAAGGLLTAATFNAEVAAANANLLPMLSEFASSVSSGATGINNRNMFDYAKGVQGMFLEADGSQNTTSGAAAFQTSGLIFAPGATSFITNIPIAISVFAGNPHVILYDVNGNFLEDDSAALNAQPTYGGSRLNPNYAYTLPGTQTYLRFSYIPGYFGSPWANSLETAVFYSGTTAAPPPAALTPLNSYIPFSANAPVNIKTATQLGCSTNYDDCSAILNAFLATASSSNPVKLVLDGMFNAPEGLVIAAAGYTMIEGLGAQTGIGVDLRHRPKRREL
jgi:hypothetical protein